MTDRGRIAVVMAALLLAGGCRRFTSPGGTAEGAPGLSDTEGGAGHPAAGLISLVPGLDRLRVEWRANLADATPTVALFWSNDPAGVYTGSSLVVDPEEGATILEGFAPGAELFVGLALDEGAGFVPAGPVLTARTAAPVHVDPKAPPGGDGATPDTAFRDLFPAMVTAFAQGGGNLWLAGGTYADVSLGVLEGVSLYGGFAAGFDLAERDPVEHTSLLVATPGKTVLALESSDLLAVIDGLAIDGKGSATAGLDVDAHPCELRRLSVGACVRGLKLRAPDSSAAIPVSVVRCTFATSLVEGASVAGPFDLLLEDCSFEANTQEGIDMDDLVAPNAGVARVVVRDCRFADNGADGLDIDLGAPLAGGIEGGRFVLVLEDSEFDRNVGDGLLIDLDFELQPSWYAEILLRGCRARENGGAGLHLDMDAPGEALAHRVRADSNHGPGLLATSEILPGSLVVSSSAFVGNLGHGLRGAAGNLGVLTSHCVVAANGAGGVLGTPAPSSVTSSVAWIQGNPWPAGAPHHSLAADVPPVFVRAPGAYHRITGVEAGVLLLQPAPNFGVGTTVEVAEDDVERSVSEVTVDGVRVDPTRSVTPPASFGVFDGAGAVLEDWAPAPGSPSAGTGMAPAGGPAVDAGPEGSPAGGAPGIDDLVPRPLFALSGVTPPWTLPMDASSELRLRFRGGVPDAASLTTGLSAVDAQGDPLPVTAWVDGEEVRIAAPAGGWPHGARVELHGTLSSDTNVPNAAPLSIPIAVIGS